MMNREPFKTTELRSPPKAVFVNGDDDAICKDLADPEVAVRVLRDQFRFRPSWFKPMHPETRMGFQ